MATGRLPCMLPQLAPAAEAEITSRPRTRLANRAVTWSDISPGARARAALRSSLAPPPPLSCPPAGPAAPISRRWAVPLSIAQCELLRKPARPHGTRLEPADACRSGCSPLPMGRCALAHRIAPIASRRATLPPEHSRVALDVTSVLPLPAPMRSSGTVRRAPWLPSLSLSR